MAKPKTARPISANAAIEAKFSKELQELCAAFEHSVNYWLIAAYKKTPPKMESLVAQDASAVSTLNKVFKELGKRWISKFDDMAVQIATRYMSDTFKSADNAFMQSLIDAGFAVEFKPSAVVKEALKASIAESVSLIKSIPAEHLKNIEGLAMRSVMAGRDLKMFNDELKEKYGATTKRARLIAMNQTNRATATVRQARSLEAGITQGKWLHSHAGKEPRKSHVEANGKIFNIAEGCLIDGEYIQAGEKINCRCSFRPLLPI
jgi:SPP1 gp7 family putative phage head morphogenesis protein